VGAIIVLIKRLISNAKERYYWISIFYGLGILFILFFTITTMIEVPLNIRLSDTSIIISRPVKDIEIDYNSIKEIRRTTKEDLIGESRINGSTGFFGDQGSWKSKTLGEYEKYSTNNENQIYLKTNDNKKTIFSCDTPDSLISLIEEKL